MRPEDDHDPSARSSQPTREDRLAKALRENLARRKALVRAKRARGEPHTEQPDSVAGATPAHGEDGDAPL